ncbi:amidohydrolase family protein [Litorimonas haliclonae]|uniref:amidohydrolase family protein n=1 Tax=Litorimonas haliclonae TaxID=2081977 RepID=UPI0039EEBD06
MKSLYLGLLASLTFIACDQNEGVNFDILIKNANIVDTQTGDILQNQYIGINGEIIEKIASLDGSADWNGSQIIEAKGKYVIPGLWDMHMHFGDETLVDENKNMLPLYLANGVTTIRDCAADISTDVLNWRDQIESEGLLGPTIFTAGPKLEGKDSIWPGDLEIDSEAELTAALDKLDSLKVDFVKITDNTLSPELFLKSVKAATRRGYATSAHIPFELTIQDVSEAGLSTVEHMAYMLKAGSAQESEIINAYRNGEIDKAAASAQLEESFDNSTARKRYKHLAKNGTAVVPTLIGSRITSYLDEDDHLSDPELQYIGPGIIKTYDWRVNRANKASVEEIAARKAHYQKLVSLLPVVQESGMDIIAGTDAGFLNSYIYPGFALHDELEIYQESGLTPLQTLQTSVVNGPKYFGLEDRYGSVSEGKIADLLILNSNPVEDIRATREIYGLVKKAKVYDKIQLDNMLEDVKNRNK